MSPGWARFSTAFRQERQDFQHIRSEALRLRDCSYLLSSCLSELHPVQQEAVSRQVHFLFWCSMYGACLPNVISAHFVAVSHLKCSLRRAPLRCFPCCWYAAERFCSVCWSRNTVLCSLCSKKYPRLVQWVFLLESRRISVWQANWC